MKKLLIASAAALFAAGVASAQVMKNPGVENTLYSGFGSPLVGDPVYYGFLDTLQARIDVGQFTLEGMLNWGAIANVDKEGNLDNFTFEITNRNPLGYHYGYAYGDFKELNSFDAAKVGRSRFYNGYRHGQTRTDNYYVNFLWHPIAGLDVGMGTKLNWQVGPAPRYGSWLWESNAHVRQGGFSTAYDDRHGTADTYKFTPDAPGSADVVGFVPYANKYAKTAIGVRYIHDGDFKFQVGGAIPSGTNTDSFRSNFGAQFQFDYFGLSVAYEGLFQKDGNFYAGAEFGVKQFLFDVYFAWDSIDTDDDKKADNYEDMSFSAGATMTMHFDKVGISLIPESSINWFEKTDYTPAWYAGCTLLWNINEKFVMDVYSSFAIGSRDKRWDNSEETEDWSTGNIFTIRPDIKIALTNNHSINAYVNTEHRESFNGKSRWCWSTGAYWTYKLNTAASRKAGRR